MRYVGVDLHKKTISLCVVAVVRGERTVVQRRGLRCEDTAAIRDFFAQLGAFRAAVEATAHYEWLLLLIEDLADRVVLVHPKKLRVIAESTRKSDKIDAEVLAMFLCLDMLPESYRPSPRIRQYRVLVRHRCRLQRRITSVKTLVRHKLADYNQDIADLFTERGQRHLAAVALNDADRFEVTALREQLRLFEGQLAAAEDELARFARSAPLAEQEARALLQTIPGMGPVTIDVILSELGDWRRFRNQKAVAAFAGLAPGMRQSGDKRHDLHITKEGSRLLRWIMVQAAWRLVNRSPRWQRLFERTKRKTGSPKKAIVAVARHALMVVYAVLRSGRSYRLLEPQGEPLPPAHRGATSARARQKGAAPVRLAVASAPGPDGSRARAEATAKAEGASGRAIPTDPASRRSAVAK